MNFYKMQKFQFLLVTFRFEALILLRVVARDVLLCWLAREHAI